MSDRWKMNRIGFVNFWLYDEEEFPFEDGKLLLRGQNGSGKSITTQSFIPFILDGDRNPARLDPFGSKDRRMEYYFLGEEGKEEATGYLYLEFEKEHSHQYRTVAIGQRARRGKPMDFWGFVILDGRRVGRDIFFYKEVGSSKIPLSKQEMRKELGDENPFTDVQGEYKALVNKHLFGFRKPEQYEQFIQLLIKVRAPKLSKDLNPAKIYEILNESLQTLSDEDLRVMVDAMEKMDGIQESLEQLNRANTDVVAIRNEYRKYNQYVLAKKGQLYLESEQEVKKARVRMEALEQEKQELIREKEEKEERQLQVKEELGVRRTEKEGLMDAELEDADRRLERAKSEREKAQAEEKDLQERWNQCQERIRESDRKINLLSGDREVQEDRLRRNREELEELQELLRWSGHAYAMQLIKEENTGDVLQQITEYKRLVTEGKKAVSKYAEAAKAYDEQAQQLELCNKAADEKAYLTERAGEDFEEKKDEMVQALYQAANHFSEWKLQRETLETAERLLQSYGGARDAGMVMDALREDCDRCRRELQGLYSEKETEYKGKKAEGEELYQKIKALQEQPEIEPERSEEIILSRQRLQAAGVRFVPFYKAVEFDEKLTERERSGLEASLQAMGILDALVVAGEEQKRVEQQFPELRDTILCVDGVGHSNFSGLRVSGELEQELREETARILSHIYEQESTGGICLRADGTFRQGVLTGRMDKESEAAYVGVLARRRRKEQALRELQAQREQLMRQLDEMDVQLQTIKKRRQLLEEEYKSIPGFENIDAAMQQLQQCRFELERLTQQAQIQEKKTLQYQEEKNRCYQGMIKCCKELPYGRTLEEYEEAENTAQEYQNIWQELCGMIQQLQNITGQIVSERDRMEREEENADWISGQRRSAQQKIKEKEMEIRQFEEYLNRAEIREKAQRLKEVKETIENLEEEKGKLHDRLIRLNDRLDNLREKEEEDKLLLQDKIGRETMLRSYFEEELSLKLVLERQSRTLTECAKEAIKLPKDGELSKEYGAAAQSLYNVYQKHNGNLVSYGAVMEDCFEDAEIGNALRKRVQIVSVWNGKRLYLEEFYNVLRTAIEETELLIQKKDRELFEDILSQTISQQLTDRITESRKWVKDMSELMKNMDTSMGLSFSLDWKPRSADNAQELDTAELEHILLRDRELLTTEDIEKVAAHFRSKIRTEKQRAEEMGDAVNYMDMVREALDYRKWFLFQMSFYRNQGEKKLLTNAAFNRFSGGEKAMAMYVPLFAAVNAQYRKAENAAHPRIIALDEAFAGVDDKNISSMFDLVERLDFDYIMNSQVLWGCFETVKGLKIAELLRPQNSSVVTVIHYTWNGQERILDEQ